MDLDKFIWIFTPFPHLISSLVSTVEAHSGIFSSTNKRTGFPQPWPALTVAELGGSGWKAVGASALQGRQGGNGSQAGRAASHSPWTSAEKPYWQLPGWATALWPPDKSVVTTGTAARPRRPWACHLGKVRSSKVHEQTESLLLHGSGTEECCVQGAQTMLGSGSRAYWGAPGPKKTIQFSTAEADIKSLSWSCGHLKISMDLHFLVTVDLVTVDMLWRMVHLSPP